MRISNVIVLMTGMAVAVSAQTPLSISNVGRSSSDRGARIPQEVGPENPWMKWAVSGEANIKALAGDGKFSEQWLLAASKLTYEIPMGTSPVHLPVMANLAAVNSALGDGTKKDSVFAAINALTSSTDGLNVGVYPYWFLGAWGQALHPTFFLGASAKLNSFKDSVGKTDQSLLTGRFAAGIEFLIGAINPGSDDKPLTISFTVVHSRFGADAYRRIFNESRSHINSAELTSILPVSTNAGVLFETVVMERARPSFRLGMMVAAAKKNDNTPSTSGGEPTPAGCTAQGCPVNVDGSNLADGDKVTVTEASSTVKPKNADGFTCEVNKTTLCTFIIPKLKTIRLTVPNGFAIGGAICTGPPACEIAAGKAGKVNVTKSAQ